MKMQLYVAALLMMTAACTGTPTTTPMDQEAICARGIVTSRQAATALLRGGRITIARDQEIQASLDAAEPGCRLVGQMPPESVKKP